MNKKVYTLYHDLLKKHGEAEKFWPQWCAAKKTAKDRGLIAIGAILTQRTSWNNAHLALKNLKRGKLLSLKNIAGLTNLNKLTNLTRPAGFYQTKPRRVFEFASFVTKNYINIDRLKKENLRTARDKLLSLYGIGPETADTILLYALDKLSFVIDEYTKRFVARHLSPENITYDFLKDLFENNLPKKVGVYQNYHTLIIVDQKGEEGSFMKKL